MTQKELLQTVLSELVHIKKHMPNGELQAMIEDVKDLKMDISDLKYTLLNPEDGVIVKTNKNSEFRMEMQSNERDFQANMAEVEDLKKWKDFADRISNGNETVEIALIGKYTDLKDSYISHEESLRYAGALLDCKVKIRWIEAPDLEDSGNTESLEGVNGGLCVQCIEHCFNQKKVNTSF